MSLIYEPSPEPLHISTKQLFLHHVESVRVPSTTFIPLFPGGEQYSFWTHHDRGESRLSGCVRRPRRSITVAPSFINSCITQLKAQGPSWTCDESKEEVKNRTSFESRFENHSGLQDPNARDGDSLEAALHAIDVTPTNREERESLLNL